MAAMNEIAAQLMQHLCEHDGRGGHGYSQGSRWGDGTSECLNLGGQDYWIANGDRDCSSGIISVYQAAGLPVDATYTGNMIPGFLATGMFEWHGMDFTAQRGDIYLNVANHTAMCLWPDPDVLGEFCISENGGIYGEQGDQTGWESYIHDYYDYPWDGILHFTGGEASGYTPEYIPAPAEKAPAPPITFRVKIKDGKRYRWLKPNRVGKRGCPIVALAIDFGGNGWYQVCTRDQGWLDPVRGYDIHDDDNGYAGWNNSPVVAVRAYYETPNPGETGYYCAKYRVSDIRQKYYPWQYDDETGNGQDGYAGDMNEIDRFHIRLA